MDKYCFWCKLLIDGIVFDFYTDGIQFDNKIFCSLNCREEYFANKLRRENDPQLEDTQDPRS